MDKASKRAYVFVFNNKKSLPARISDFAGGCVITYLVVSLILYEMRVPRAANVICSVLISAAVLTGYFLVRTVRFDRFVKKQREEMRKRLCFESLLLCTDDEFCHAASGCVKESDAHIIVYQHKKPMDEDALLCIYRQEKCSGEGKTACVSLYGYDDGARARAQKLCIELYCGEDMIKADACEKITDDEADAAFVSSVDGQRKPKLKEKFGKGSAKGYLVCGIILLVTSFFMRYAIYFRLVGTACMWLAAVKAAMENRAAGR